MSPIKNYISPLIIFFLLSVSHIYSQDNDFYENGWNFKLNGYYKNLFMYQENNEFYINRLSPPENKKMISDLNRIRLSPEINFDEIFTLHADTDFEAITSNYNRTIGFNNFWKVSNYNDFIKPSWENDNNSKVYTGIEFQNIYAKMVKGNFTGTAGRQQIRFGSSKLWNPFDIMNPLSPLLIEGNDNQKGTDALRVDWYHGGSTELTGVFNPKKENDSYNDIGPGSGNYLARLKNGAKEADIALLAGYTAKRKNIGADFAAVINDGLLTGVFLYSKPDKGAMYYQCGSGYEYNFSSGIYLLIEYFYNSSPVNDYRELQVALYQMKTDGIDSSNYYILSNRIITYNSHYASINAGYNFFPLLRGEFFSIYDFQGRGLFFNISLKLNALENLDFIAGIITAFVNDSDRVSDFQMYDKSPVFYTSLQFYF